MQELYSGALLQGGKYKIEYMLGQGGFGITYRALMKGAVSGSLGGMTVNVPVVVKEFFMKDFCMRVDGSTYVSVPSTGFKEQTDRYRQKFIKEAKNIASLSHPNIVKVIDVFEENGTVYYVMEYLEGDSLRQLMENGPLPEQQAVAYIRQIGDALRYMHDEKHLCHLDVKPSNIMLNAEGMAMLIDFGISKSYDEKGNETSSTPVGLTKGYAPLEQYQNALHEFSPVTDIYSLGATLLALLTGETPPEAADVFENGIGAQPAGISTKTWQAIQAAMTPHRKSRPQTVAAFLDILDNGLPEETRRVEEIQDATTTLVDTSSDSQSRPDLQPLPEIHVDYFFPKQKSNVKMYVIIVVVAALIGGGIFWAVSHKGGNTDAQQEQAAAVQTTDKWKEVGNYSEGLARVQDANGKCGFIDQTGRLVIPCKWKDAGWFSEGLAWVEDANYKWGYIDKTGQVVIPCEWTSAGIFREGLADVQDDNYKVGFIDKTGKIVSPCQWKKAYGFHEGLARVVDAHGKYGFIDKTGRLVIPCQWKWARDFHKGWSDVQGDNGKWVQIDKTGKVTEF